MKKLLVIGLFSLILSCNNSENAGTKRRPDDLDRTTNNDTNNVGHKPDSAKKAEKR